MLAGALVGTVAGGVLIDASPAALFAVGAVVVLLLALPTLALRIVRGRVARSRRRPRSPARAASRCCCAPRARPARARCCSRSCCGSSPTPR